MYVNLRNSLSVQDLISKSDVGDILDSALYGRHLGLNECIRLIKSDDAYSIGLVGSIIRQKLYGNTVTFVNNIILNYTNVCITYCKFCAFYRPPGHSEEYTLTKEAMAKKIQETKALGGVQILLQGGHHPYLKLDWYEDMLRHMKSFDIHVHGFSPSEIQHFAT